MRIIKSVLLIIVFSLLLTPDIQAESDHVDEPFAVVELFTSEGCSSCPPADALLVALAEIARSQGSRVFALGFHVDYWDGLGWPDRFSQEVFTKRQYHYARQHNTSVYTPQMIINGKDAFGGYKRGQAVSLIEEALKQPPAADLEIHVKQLEKNRIQLVYSSKSYRDGLELNLALVEEQVSTKVLRGENRGKELNHANVVRSFNMAPLQPAGQVNLDIPADLQARKALLIAFISDIKTGFILAAESLKI